MRVCRGGGSLEKLANGAVLPEAERNGHPQELPLPLAGVGVPAPSAEDRLAIIEAVPQRTEAQDADEARESNHVLGGRREASADQLQAGVARGATGSRRSARSSADEPRVSEMLRLHYANAEVLLAQAWEEVEPG